MDRETRIAPASGAGPPDAVDPADKRRPDDPPGMDAIRRFFRHPFFQGIWLWLRAIGGGLRAVWKWLDKNAGPIARGVEQAGNVAVRASRGAVKVGHAAGEIGGKLSEWGRARRDAGGARLRRIGKGMRRFGSRATRIGTQAEDVAESVEDLGEELVSITGGDTPEEHRVQAPEPRERRSSDRHRGPTGSRNPRVADSGKARALPPPADPPSSPVESTSEAAALPAGDPNGELPEVFRDRIRALGKRRRSKPLRQLILDICTFREWTTVGELAEWFGMDESNLQKRQLRPMLKSGQLRLRYPENKSHPEQAYRAVSV